MVIDGLRPKIIAAALSCALLFCPGWRASAAQSLRLDGRAGGKLFDGLGAVSGGGAT